MNRKNYGPWALAGVLLLLIAGLGWWYWKSTRPPEPIPVAAEASAPEPAAPAAPPPPSAPPPVQHPIEATPQAAEAAAPLPPLDESDSFVTNALTGLLGRKAVLSQLQTDGFVRRVVATVDNLARPRAATRLWPVNPIPGRFSVDHRGDQDVIGADNGLRYAPLVLLVESVDADALVRLYVRLYPLFQQSYEELGYPHQYFNDRLVEVIDHLLAAPEPATAPAVHLVDIQGAQGPVKLERPWVHYEFVDPALESLSSGQKIMVRMGLVNERRVKARLQTFRRALTGQSAPR